MKATLPPRRDEPPGPAVDRRPWNVPLVFGVAYLACAAVGHLVSPSFQVFACFWLPSGLFVATLLRRGSARWPGIVAAGFGANLAFDLWNGNSPADGLAFATGACVEGLTGAWLIRRFVTPQPDLSTTREVSGLIGFSALLSTALCTTLGTLAVADLNGQRATALGWLHLWSSNLLGVLLMAPVILAWSSPSRWRFRRSSTARKAELGALFLVASTVAVACFRDAPHSGYSFKYLVIPGVLWAALRFDLRITAIMNLIVALIVARLTTWNYGLLAQSSPVQEQQAASLQLFLAVGTLIGLFVTAIVNERRQAETAARESAEKFRAYVEQASDALFVHDFSGRITDVNRQACASLGYSREELLRMTVFDVETDFDLARAQIAWSQIRPEQPFTLRGRQRRKDGTLFPVEVQCGCFDLKGERRYMGLARDITARQQVEAEREKLEAQLRQSQKMEAVGTLAGGIAHDFNNILSGIYGFTALAREGAGNNTRVLEYLDEIGRAGRRAADLVRQILSFSRAGDQKMEPVQLRPVVTEAVRLLRATIPVTIEFDLQLAKNLPLIRGNSIQLHQVVMNLGTNAAHAMRDRPGRLSFRLEACEVDEAVARTLTAFVAGACVRLTVSDTGCGMEAATRERVFEPFYTTKGPGEGTGLGLSVVHGIVSRHHGAIRLTSEVGHGTTFEIYLPATDQAPAERAGESAPMPRGQGERILFVDDEATIARVGELTLRNLGYVAVGECLVLEALARLEREPQTFQLVITDQTMAGLTGLEFAARIRALRADLPVVILSGYSPALTPERIEAAGVREVLSKPYTMGALAAVVHRQLHSGPPS